MFSKTSQSVLDYLYKALKNTLLGNFWNLWLFLQPVEIEYFTEKNFCFNLKKKIVNRVHKTVLSFLDRSCGLWFLIQRTKQCLDFSCTAHLIHLFACWFYNGHFPSSISWWLLHIACLAIMCICGEFLCMRSELKAIPLSLGPKADL